MDWCTAGPWSSAGPGSETVVIGYVSQKGMFRTDTCYNVLNASPEILGIIDRLVKISVVRGGADFFSKQIWGLCIYNFFQKFWGRGGPKRMFHSVFMELKL